MTAARKGRTRIKDADEALSYSPPRDVRGGAPEQAVFDLRSSGRRTLQEAGVLGKYFHGELRIGKVPCNVVRRVGGDSIIR